MTIRYSFFVRPPFLYCPVRITLGIPLITPIRSCIFFVPFCNFIFRFSIFPAPLGDSFKKVHSTSTHPESTVYVYNTRVRTLHAFVGTGSGALCHCNKILYARIVAHVYTRGQVLFFNASTYCYVRTGVSGPRGVSGSCGPRGHGAAKSVFTERRAQNDVSAADVCGACVSQ